MLIEETFRAEAQKTKSLSEKSRENFETNHPEVTLKDTSKAFSENTPTNDTPEIISKASSLNNPNGGADDTIINAAIEIQPKQQQKFQKSEQDLQNQDYFQKFPQLKKVSVFLKRIDSEETRTHSFQNSLDQTPDL